MLIARQVEKVVEKWIETSDPFNLFFSIRAHSRRSKNGQKRPKINLFFKKRPFLVYTIHWNLKD